MVPESTETPSTEGKERIHARRGNIYDTYGIPSNAYEKQNYHPKSQIPDTKKLDIEVVKYYDRLRSYPDTEYLESGYQQYVRSVLEDFCSREAPLWEIQKISSEFYFLVKGSKFTYKTSNGVTRLSSIPVTKHGYQWASWIFDDLDTITFLIYRAALKRHRPMITKKVNPFYYYLNVTTFSYIGNYLSKIAIDTAALLYETLPEIQCWDVIEDITTYQQASNWPTKYEKISSLCGMHPKSAHYIFTKNSRDNSSLAKEGYFTLRSRNVSSSSKQ